jgi:CRP-like cAMP-binding protein
MTPESGSAFLLLRNLTATFHPLPETEWLAFSEIWQPFRAKRKEVLTLAGETERYLYFVVDGVQRVYYVHGVREATLVFTYSPSFGGVFDSLMQQKPSRFFYETLSPSFFLRAPATDFLQLLEECPGIEKMVRKGITYTLAGMMERMVEWECFSAEERFRKLLQRSPHILQLVPHKYLANYIGIDPTNFSKLMNSVRI